MQTYVDYLNPHTGNINPTRVTVSDETYNNFMHIRRLHQRLLDEYMYKNIINTAHNVRLYVGPNSSSMCWRTRESSSSDAISNIILGEEHVSDMNAAIWIHLHEFAHSVQFESKRLTIHRQSMVDIEYTFDGVREKRWAAGLKDHANLPFEKEADHHANNNYDYACSLLGVSPREDNSWARGRIMIDSRVRPEPNRQKFTCIDRK